MKRLIKQDTLRHILTLREVVAARKRQLADEQRELDDAEFLILSAVDRGDPAETGPLACGISVQPGARRPKWKEEYASVCGPLAVERVIAETEPGAPSRSLVIMDGGKVTR